MNQIRIDNIWAALRTVQDPELGFNIVELGLVYDVQMQPDGKIGITMTLTTPTCPLQDHFQTTISQALAPIVTERQWRLEFTFTPPWSLAKADLAIQQHFALLGIPLSRF